MNAEHEGKIGILYRGVQGVQKGGIAVFFGMRWPSAASDWACHGLCIMDEMAFGDMPHAVWWFREARLRMYHYY